MPSKIKIRLRHILFIGFIGTTILLLSFESLNDRWQHPENTIVILTDRIPEIIQPHRWTELTPRRFLPLLYPNLGDFSSEIRFHSQDKSIEIKTQNPDWIERCLKPAVASHKLFPWIKSRIQKNTLFIQTDISALGLVAWLQYLPFSEKNGPCAPENSKIPFPEKYKITEHSLQKLVLKRQTSEAPTLMFISVQDELTQIFRLIRKDADVAFNSISVSKTHWIDKTVPSFQVIRSKGHHLSVIGFRNLHPLTAETNFRKWIQQVIPTADWARTKGYGFLDPFDFSKTPVAESVPISDADFLTWLEKNYPIQKTGYRAALLFCTTTQREGFELAQLLKSVLKKYNIDLKIKTLEPVLLNRAIREGKTDFFTLRILRNSADDSLFSYLHPKGHRNTFDPIPPEAFFARSPGSLQDLAPFWSTALPFIPLWTWNHGLILSKELDLPPNLPLKDDFSFLNLVKIKKPEK